MQLFNALYERRRISEGLILASLLLLIAGCSKKPAVAPVSGKVLYNGAPLPYGNVTFQPAAGQPAAGAIESDGSFRLSTFSEFDGAMIGTHKVRISCYTSQSPSHKSKARVGETSLGNLLIPTDYTYADKSELTATVPPKGANDLVFELKGPKQTFPK